MEWEIKRIPIWPVAKVSFFIFLILSLIGSLFYTIFISAFLEGIMSLVGEAMPMDGMSMTAGASFVFALFMSLFLSVFYTLITVLMALVYNGIAGIGGGLRFEMRQWQKVVQQPVDAAQSAQLSSEQAPITPPSEDAEQL